MKLAEDPILKKYFISWSHKYEGEANKGFGSATIKSDLDAYSQTDDFLIYAQKCIAQAVEQEEKALVTDFIIINFFEVKNED